MSTNLSSVKEDLAEDPVFWRPITTVLMVISVFFFAQIIASVLIAIYPALKGWGAEQTKMWLQTSTSQFLLIAFIESSIVLLVWFLLHVKKIKLKVIGLKKPKPLDIAYAMIGFMAYFMIYVALAAFVAKLFPHIDFGQKQQIGFEAAKHSKDLVLVFLSLVVLPPVVEEILCRGFLYTGLRTKYSVWKAGLITSFLFGLAHLQIGSGAPLLWVAAIDTFTLSLVLVYLREKTGGLGAPILLHMLKNSVAFYVLFVIAAR
jgi:membrane protease YdiL (CAAX protease family)